MASKFVKIVPEKNRYGYRVGYWDVRSSDPEYRVNYFCQLKKVGGLYYGISYHVVRDDMWFWRKDRDSTDPFHLQTIGATESDVPENLLEWVSDPLFDIELQRFIISGKNYEGIR